MFLIVHTLGKRVNPPALAHFENEAVFSADERRWCRWVSRVPWPGTLCCRKYSSPGLSPSNPY